MGKRGEWYVFFQFILIVLIVGGPQGPKLSLTSFFWLALVFFILGILLFLLGVCYLGRNLTPLPLPKENSTLVQNGPYALVRHPIYCGVILIGLAWFFWVQGLLTLLFVFFLFIFFDIKSRKEEMWLCQKFSNYRLYQKRVKKLIPYIY